MAVTQSSTTRRSSNQFFSVIPTQGGDANILVGNKDVVAIPCDSDGTNPVYTGASVTFDVYEGSSDSTASWTLSVYATSYVSGNLVSDTYTVTSITSDVGYFTIRASKVGYDSLYRKISVFRVRKGAAGAAGANPDNYVYIAYADDKEGTGFTTTFTDDKEYFALLLSESEISSPAVGDFAGLWRPFYNYPTKSSYDKFSCFPTEDCHWWYLGNSYCNMSPSMWYYKGTYRRIYFVMKDYYLNAAGTARSGHTANKTSVCYYDIDGKYFAVGTTIAHDYPLSTDGHDIATVIVSDDGHIIVMKEKLRNAGSPAGLHNSPMEIWRSNNVEDASAFTNVATISLTEGFAYPNMVLGPNSGEIYAFFRHNTGASHHYLRCIRSLDNGATWVSLAGVSNTTTTIAQCDSIVAGPTDWYFYLKVATSNRDTGIHVLGILNEGPGGTSPDGTDAASRYKLVMYLHSADGETWENINSYKGTSGDFSKDVVSSGYITAAELLANFVVSNYNAVVRVSSNVRDFGVDGEGNPYIVDHCNYKYDTSENPDYSGKDNTIYDVYLRHFDTGTNAWVSQSIKDIFKDPSDIDATVYSFNGSSMQVMYVYEDGTIDMIFRRIITNNDRYEGGFTPITSSSLALRGGLFKINTTQTNNFGEGVVAGDYFAYTSSETINASNTFLPLEQEIVFMRTTDYGATWTEIRPPINFTGEDRYATSNGLLSAVGNNQDSGIMGVFVGVSKALPSVTAYDHSELYLFWDQIKIE